jgi:DNA-directed RNA polymerase specialized sigma24 family protein
MKAPTGNQIIEMIADARYDEALNGLYRKAGKECLLLIKSKSRRINHSEAMSIFYASFLEFCRKSAEGDFSYRDEDAFISYFKTTCAHQSYRHLREEKMPGFIIEDDITDVLGADADIVARDTVSTFVKHKAEKYDISLDPEEVSPKQSLLKEVTRVFHGLSDRCKFLIVLKFFLNLSHREIVDTLDIFYGIRNEEVCKTDLYRCLEQIRERTDYEAAVN